MPTVALFITCLVDTVAPDVGDATVRLLEHAGCSVEYPAAQTCCGQPGVTSGQPEAAARLARHHIEVFEPYDAVVSPSGSCVAMVHHWYPRLLDGGWRARAERLAARTFELGSYLADELGRVDLGVRVPVTATVHDSCHGLRTLGAGDPARRLLAAAGVTVCEMAQPETCCGFGGSFAVSHGEIAGPLADRKLADAASTPADHLVGGDTGCLVHLEGRRRRTGVGPPPVHLAELLARGLP